MSLLDPLGPTFPGGSSPLDNFAAYKSYLIKPWADLVSYLSTKAIVPTPIQVPTYVVNGKWKRYPGLFGLRT